MSAKKWVKVFIVVVCLSIILAGPINFIVDPLWTFKHKNIFNAKQLPFDERQQKTNNIYFSGLDNYEGIILGSSRVGYINQNDFLNMKLYNYGMGHMLPSQHIDYLDFVKEIKGEDLKYISIGVDFFGTNKANNNNAPAYYISKAKSPMYRYKMLFSVDLLIQSIRNIIFNLQNKPYSHYLRNKNILIMNEMDDTNKASKYKQGIISSTKSFGSKQYKWNDNYFNILKNLKKDNPHTKFMVFTTPVVADLFVSIVKNANRFSEYKRWIRGLVDVFGEIYCFMGINSITINSQNYADPNHYYSHTGKIIANKISTNDFNSPPKDFGMIVDENNVEAFLKRQEEQIKAYKFSDDYPMEEVERFLQAQ